MPDADIVHDQTYHVSSYLGKAVDQVRRQEHKELMAQGDETLKGSRQLWLYNPENFSPEQRSEFGALKDLHLKVATGLGGQGTVHQILGLSGGGLGAAVLQGMGTVGSAAANSSRWSRWDKCSNATWTIC